MRRSVGRRFLRNIRRRGTRKPSDLEVKVSEFLTAEGIEFKQEFKISRIHVDFYLPATHTAVEVQGCWVHACPKCYKNATKTQLRKRGTDRRRFVFIQNRGFNLLVLWGHDIEKNWKMCQRKLREAGKCHS
jgi:very-short-patch-repair endonuclease